MNGGNAQARPAQNPFFCGPKCGEREQSAIWPHESARAGRNGAGRGKGAGRAVRGSDGHPARAFARSGQNSPGDGHRHGPVRAGFPAGTPKGDDDGKARKTPPLRAWERPGEWTPRGGGGVGRRAAPRTAGRWRIRAGFARTRRMPTDGRKNAFPAPPCGAGRSAPLPGHSGNSRPAPTPDSAARTGPTRAGATPLPANWGRNESYAPPSGWVFFRRRAGRALAGNTPLNFLHSQLKNGQLLWTPTGI